jgi:hypothetical protein
MANVTFKVAINNAEFPLSLALGSREVLDPGMDIASRTNPAFAGGSASLDWNMIQVQYAQNHIPTEKGYQAIWWSDPGNLVGASRNIVAAEQAVTSLSGSQISGVSTILATEVAGSSQITLEHVSSAGNAPISAGPATFAIPPGFNSALMQLSVAGFGSQPYIAVRFGSAVLAGGTLTIYRFLSPTPVVVTWPAGISQNDIIAIAAVSNYMIAMHRTGLILWSTPTNPLDFASTNLGAGSQLPIDITGYPIHLRAIAGGFVIYTALGAIGATATNNPSTPFIFAAISGAAGLVSDKVAFPPVAGSAQDEAHWVQTLAGIQRVTLRGAETVLHKISEVYRSERWYKVSSAASSPVVAEIFGITVQSQQTAHLVMLHGRYLIVSRSPAGDGRHFVYDTALRRASLLNISTYDSVPVIAESFATSYVSALSGLNLYRKALQSGQAFSKYANIVNSPTTSPAPVLIVGPIQLRRSRSVTVTEVRLYGDFLTYTGQAVISAYLWPITSEDSVPFTVPVLLTPVSATSRCLVFQCRDTAESFLLAIEGLGNFSAITLKAQVHGIR